MRSPKLSISRAMPNPRRSSIAVAATAIPIVFTMAGQNWGSLPENSLM